MPTGEEAPIWTYFPSLCDTTQRSSLPFKDPLLRETNVAGAIFEKVRKNSSGKNRRGWRWISESQAAQNMPFGHGSVCITETWVKTRNEMKLRNNKKLHYNQSVWGYIQFYTCVKGTTIPTNQYIYFFFWHNEAINDKTHSKIMEKKHVKLQNIQNSSIRKGWVTTSK
jgi:hypothetical protein